MAASTNESSNGCTGCTYPLQSEVIDLSDLKERVSAFTAASHVCFRVKVGQVTARYGHRNPFCSPILMTRTAERDITKGIT